MRRGWADETLHISHVPTLWRFGLPEHKTRRRALYLVRWPRHDNDLSFSFAAAHEPGFTHSIRVSTSSEKRKPPQTHARTWDTSGRQVCTWASFVAGL